MPLGRLQRRAGAVRLGAPLSLAAGMAALVLHATVRGAEGRLAELCGERDPDTGQCVQTARAMGYILTPGRQPFVEMNQSTTKFDESKVNHHRFARSGPCDNWDDRTWDGQPVNGKLRTEFGTDRIERVSKLSHQDFVTKYLSKGVPVIVTDAIHGGWKAKKWNCSTFAGEFPTAMMSGNLPGQEEEFYRVEDNIEPLGSTARRCIAGYIQTEYTDNELEPNAQYQKKWLASLIKPYFLNPPRKKGARTPRGQHWKNAVIYLGNEGTGQQRRVDDSCDTVALAQFSGTRQFTISRVVMRGGKLGYGEPYAFVLYPGEMLVFYGTQRFHYEVIEGCSVSAELTLSEEMFPDEYFGEVQEHYKKVGFEAVEDMYLDSGSFGPMGPFFYTCGAGLKGRKGFKTTELKKRHDAIEKDVRTHARSMDPTDAKECLRRAGKASSHYAKNYYTKMAREMPSKVEEKEEEKPESDEVGEGGEDPSEGLERWNGKEFVPWKPGEPEDMVWEGEGNSDKDGIRPPPDTMSVAEGGSAGATEHRDEIEKLQAQRDHDDF